MAEIDVLTVKVLPDRLPSLVSESEAEGFAFLARLVDEWRSGLNRFSLDGEALIVARRDKELLGIGGLNRDPYANDPSIGRVRHFYVRASVRGRGIGRALLTEIVTRAAANFRELRLRTDSSRAARFYERFGFTPGEEGASFTHQLKLGAAARLG